MKLKITFVTKTRNFVVSTFTNLQTLFTSVTYSIYIIEGSSDLEGIAHRTRETNARKKEVEYFPGFQQIISMIIYL